MIYRPTALSVADSPRVVGAAHASHALVVRAPGSMAWLSGITGALALLASQLHVADAYCNAMHHARFEGLICLATSADRALQAELRE